MLFIIVDHIVGLDAVHNCTSHNWSVSCVIFKEFTQQIDSNKKKNGYMRRNYSFFILK